MFRLGADPLPAALAAYPKIARLDALMRDLEGGDALAVPPGLACVIERANQLPSFALEALGPPPYIARMALAQEDGETGSMAGQGLSVPDLHDRAQLESAFAAMQARAEARGWPRWALLVQPQCGGERLGVAAFDARGASHVELYPIDALDALEGGRTPVWSGPVAAMDPSAAGPLRQLAARYPTQFAHGVDLEFVIEGARLWCVQVRPLTRPLFPDWPAFRAALELAHPEGAWREGAWQLDAEHNPEPLSYAHADLLRALVQAKGAASGEPTAFCGWLYARHTVRQLAGPAKQAPPPIGLEEIRGLLDELFGSILVEARAQSEAWRSRCAKADASALAAALPEAYAAFDAMISTYVGKLVPARARSRSREGDPAAPLSLRAKAAHADVLLSRWDLDSPSLEELGLPRALAPSAATRPDLPSSVAACLSLLEESDDLLFAHGLAPLRFVYRAAAERLAWTRAEVFGLGLEELAEALRVASRRAALRDIAYSRMADRERWAQLRPPALLFEGEPRLDTHEFGGRRGRDRAAYRCGEPHEGPLVVCADLEALLRLAPDPASIVCMPTLSAAAALAIERLGLRAVCTEYGGAMSHGALLARELGLSALIGLRGCTTRRVGRLHRLDARSGRLVELDRSALR